jgi:hypothetical protein
VNEKTKISFFDLHIHANNNSVIFDSIENIHEPLLVLKKQNLAQVIIFNESTLNDHNNNLI